MHKKIFKNFILPIASPRKPWYYGYRKEVADMLDQIKTLVEMISAVASLVTSIATLIIAHKGGKGKQ